MKTFTALLAVAALSPAVALAQSQAPAAAAPAASAPSARVAIPAEPAEATEKGEPNVKWTIIEDDSVRIDEMKVRGNTQKITVTPKIGPTKGYEIIMPDGSRDLSFGANTSRGAAGKRVWSVLTF